MVRCLVFAEVLACITLPAVAQEQVGSIEGVVRDQQGGVVPGTVVEAHSLAVGSSVTVVTDAEGVFRFVGMPPGYYDVSTTVPGFRSMKFERVEVLTRPGPQQICGWTN